MKRHTYQAEIFPEHTFILVDYKYLIKWNLKNARLCWVFADLVTYFTECITSTCMAWDTVPCKQACLATANG